MNSVGDYAFAGCVKLEPFKFKNDAINYGIHVFQGCSWLDNVLFPSVGTMAAEYPDTYSKIRSVVFSSGMSEIISGACSGCSSLRYVDIPDGVVSIGTNAFLGCSSITSVVMAASVSDVASSAFSNCTKIVSATVSGLQPVSEIFPASYANITDMHVASGCETLCDNLFYGCEKIADIDIPWTVTEIGSRAFYGCKLLGGDTGIYIPEKVDAIGEEAFAYCENLKAVKFLCPKPGVATNIYYKANSDLVSGVLQVYKESWEPITNFWPVAKNVVCGRRIMWWRTDSLAKITFAYYNGTTSNNVSRYYLKNAGRQILDDDIPDDILDDEKYGEFLGWFTAPYGGEEISEGQEVTTSTTYYAHWSVNERSDEESGEYDFSSARVYNGYLADDNLKGSVQIKIAKGKAKRVDGEITTNAAVSATLQILGEGKITLKGTLDESLGAALVHARSEREMEFSVDGDVLEGSFDGMELRAHVDLFASSLRADKYSAQAVLDDYGGNYVAVLSAGGESAYSGYAGLSLSVGANGRTKVSGYLPDGAKVSATGQMCITEEGFEVPVVVPMYSGKKGGIAFLLSVSESGFEIDKVSDWLGQSGETAGSMSAVGVSKLSGLAAGSYEFRTDGAFEIDGEDIEDGLSPDGTEIVVSSSRWTLPRADTVRFTRDDGYETTKDNGNPAGLKLSYTAKTGLFKGGYKLFSTTEAERSKKRSVAVYGAVLDGAGYGTAVLKKVGGIPVTIE